MIRFALLLLVPAVSLAACNVSRGDGDAENVTMKADASGNVSFNLPFAKGDVKLPEGAIRSSDFDIDGVKLMPGATMHGFNMNAGNHGATVHLAFEAPGAPQQVRAYFLDQFKQKGVEATQSGDAISGRTRDGDQFTIDVQPVGQGSSGTIAIQSKD
ncbi:hypothetical protein [Sphingomonas sp.]|uniref:hypothetical protein n=1 Tax=Sphingomonas sp. TaxID=28214 RepID=UPI0025D3096A|nr:hypothetical protein [Sphingomonas sp.]MBV9527449.1 hypothetical protein [Sphingomonas sp.]